MHDTWVHLEKASQAGVVFLRQQEEKWTCN